MSNLSGSEETSVGETSVGETDEWISDTIHYRILDHLRARCQESNPPLLTALMGEDDLVLRELFYYREGRVPGGLRLRDFGLQYIRSFFATYSFTVGELVARHMLFLNKHCRYPYHYHEEVLTLMDEELIIYMTLQNGDLEEVILMMEG